jgi:adenylylsulfate kinase
MNKSPFVLWLMGPTSAGKTTTGRHLVEDMRASNIPAIHYDGDEIRAFFGSTLGFKSEDRLRAVTTCAHLANKANEAGLNVVVSALTANENSRDYIKTNVPNIVIAYLTCPIDICIQRDSRGLYRKAREGKIKPETLIGLDTPYNAPSNPDIVIDTSNNAPEQSIAIIKEWLNADGYKVL